MNILLSQCRFAQSLRFVDREEGIIYLSVDKS
jgi:hypothetical protein